MMRAVFLAGLLAAGPAAAETDAAALIDLLDDRCLTPLMAGQPADATGVEIASGAPAVGTPGSQHDVADVIPGVDLRLQTLRSGVSSCGLSHEIDMQSQADAVNHLLGTRMGDMQFKQLAAPCDTEGLHSNRIFESAGHTPKGNLIGVISFVIRIPGAPESQHLVVAESDVPLTRHEACN